MQNSLHRYLISMVLVAVLASCASQPAPTPQGGDSLPLPEPAVSEYVKTEGAGFTVQNDADIRYAMTYLLRKEVGDVPSFMVEFENPADGELSLANGGMLDQFQTEIAVKSPVLPCIENQRNYRVRLKLFSGNQLVAQHDDLVQFALPVSMMMRIKAPACPWKRN